ncbi:V-type ATP synthase subunit C [Halolamina pelagica]|uniref:V-type ATP synthase subunit C n=1 Tax=Halolamina pelagica TaxID=699431 RepID=A0A0N8HZM9_9EURY|nr:V-type ATP synthase subunit C [Halolamina pelagica]
MSATGSSNPEYVNARVSARRATLFDEEDYRKLLRMSPDEISRYMEESTYQGQINRLRSRFSGVDLVEYALNAGLADTFDELLAWADGRLYEQVARYLRKFDAWNVKTAVRGIYAETDPEAVEDDLIRAGEFDDVLLDQLVEAESVDAIVDLLDGTIFGDPLAAAAEQYDESGMLVPLENAIDRAYYENLFEGVTSAAGAGPESAYAEYLQAEIDFRNVRNALRLARSGAEVEPAEYFIEGGTLFTPRSCRRSPGTATSWSSTSARAATATSSALRLTRWPKRTASSASSAPSRVRWSNTHATPVTPTRCRCVR